MPRDFMKAHIGQLFLLQLVCLVIVAAMFILGGCAAQSSREMEAKSVRKRDMVFAFQVLLKEGEAALKAGEFQTAQEKYEAALEHARALGYNPGIAASLAALGLVKEKMEEYPRALELLTEALSLTTTKDFDAKVSTLKVATLNIIVRIHLRLGNQKEAFETIRVRAKTLMEKANAHKKLGQFTEAVESYRQAAADTKMLGIEDAGVTLWNAATLLKQMGKMDQAIELYIEASSLYENAGNLTNAAWILTELGETYRDKKRFQKAAEVFSEVIRLAEHGWRAIPR